MREVFEMNCPRCGSENIRRSQSQDSVWFRFVLQKKMRCQRCCFAFVAPLWQQGESMPANVMQAPSEELESVTAGGI
jgi:C4-type Zn-finger protein